MASSKTGKADGSKKVAVACQGGGMHAAFAIGVLKAILERLDKGDPGFKLAGLSGTSAGALCALMAWYGLAPKKAGPGTPREAIEKLETFWQDFVAKTEAENLLNILTFGAFRAEEIEVPVLGLSARVLGINPYRTGYKAFAACLPSLGVRKEYFDLTELLAETCPDLKSDTIKWAEVHTRLLIGASEVVDGLETVFDSAINKGGEGSNTSYWRQQLPLSLEGVAASGTLPALREAQRIGKGYYWDGLYSQNPPVREFIAGSDPEDIPDELWIVRINPQQWPYVPSSNKDIEDRQNELMGNLSLNKELDFILKVNEWQQKYEDFGRAHKQVTIRTIKMEEKVADELSYSSKFDRSRERMTELCAHGHKVALRWLDDWQNNKAGEYPKDAAYRAL
ncbi:MAG TPA: patatin-like phospholipase family protein [Pseudolabrys sp.]|nr:patatin-like phospholipase family protein [Pseudolabrys sp.]